MLESVMSLSWGLPDGAIIRGGTEAEKKGPALGLP